MKAKLGSLYCLLFAISSMGCGGGGSSSGYTSTAQTVVTPSVTISWPARSRSIQGPASALSATITLLGASTSGTDVSFSEDRLVAPAAYSQTYTYQGEVMTGSHTLKVTFFSLSGSVGLKVAQATAAVSVKANGSLSNPDGAALGSVVAQGLLSKVSVLPDQQCPADQTLLVSISATDVLGNIVAINDGAATFQFSAATSFATLDSSGDLVGISPGTVTVQATVDGIVSAAQPISITAPQAIITPRTVSLPTNAMVQDPVTGMFWASVSSSATNNQNSVVQINPSSGSNVSSIAVDGQASALGISDDGTELYAGMNSVNSVQPINLTNGTLGQPFLVPGVVSQPLATAHTIKVEPGNPNTIAVAAFATNGLPALSVLDSGVPRPSSFLTPYLPATSIGFSDSDHLVAFNGNDSGFEYLLLSVDSNGLTLQNTLTNLVSGFGTTLNIVGSKVYGSDGTVLDGATGTLLGRFLTQDPLSCAIDVANNRAFFLSYPGGPYSLNAPATVTAYKLTDFTLVASAQIATFPTGLTSSSFEADLTRWGAKGLAFRSPNQLFFIDNAPGL